MGRREWGYLVFSLGHLHDKASLPQESEFETRLYPCFSVSRHRGVTLVRRFGQDIYGVCLASAVLAGCLVTGCCLVVDCDSYALMESATVYSLEIVNLATARVRVDVSMPDGTFLDADPIKQTPEQRRSRSWSGILTLDIGDRSTFRISFLGGKDSNEDGYLVRYFGAIRFFAEDSYTPYRIYKYQFSGCLPAFCDDPDDDASYAHFTSRDGPPAFLFVESSDRPFFLERDRDDPELGRIAITFVPDAEPAVQGHDGASGAGG